MVGVYTTSGVVDESIVVSGCEVCFVGDENDMPVISVPRAFDSATHVMSQSG